MVERTRGNGSDCKPDTRLKDLVTGRNQPAPDRTEESTVRMPADVVQNDLRRRISSCRIGIASMASNMVPVVRGVPLRSLTPPSLPISSTANPSGATS